MRIVSLFLCWVVVFCIGCPKQTPPPPESKYEPTTEPTSAAEPTPTPTAVETPQKSLPPLGEPTMLEPGIRFYDVTLDRAGTPMKVWIYLPEPMPEGEIPLVVIAPAGTPLFLGMGLAQGDQAEHLPYVRAGFAVVSYELDGTLDRDEATDADVIAAAKKFQAAKAGVANAQAALDYVLGQVPNIDPNRIYAVGHSSAATLALLLTSQEPRIAACVAFAPVVDVPTRLKDAIPTLSQEMPLFGAFVKWSSPSSHEHELRCPLLLFHARDDSNVDVQESIDLAETLKPTNPNVKLILVPKGGHYESMIDPGIPRAIEWLKALPKEQ